MYKRNFNWVIFSLIINVVICSCVEKKKDILSYEVNNISSYEATVVGADKQVRSVNVPEYVRIGSNKYKVVSIGDSAFCNCSNLSEITLPNTIRTIGRYAFCGCVSLKEIIIPESVHTINVGAFKNCKSLSSVNFNTDRLYLLGSGAFFNCTSLKSISIYEIVDEGIGSYAFKNCSSLVEVVCNVSNIQKYAFQNCNSLKNVRLYIYSGVINEGLFQNCSSLEEFPHVGDITKISSRSFEGCTSLTKIQIPSDVKEIENNAFLNCSNLEEVRLRGDQLYYRDAFIGCPKLKMNYKNLTTDNDWINWLRNTEFEYVDKSEKLKIRFPENFNMEYFFNISFYDTYKSETDYISNLLMMR